MVSLSVQYLAIYSYNLLPNGILNVFKKVQKFAKCSLTPFKMAKKLASRQGAEITPNLVTLAL